jgi:glycosyltransferase involved in cell wall biosynthesis
MPRTKRVTFSVVLPTLNEGAMLAMTVDSIVAERCDADAGYEIIVVDDGSSDGSTASLKAQRRPEVKVVSGGGLGVARARNLGASRARGEYVVFMDAHCRVSPGWLESFADLLSVAEVGLAGPSFTKLETPLPRGCGMYWADYTLDPCWFEPLDGEVYIVPLTTGACQAFRRDTFEALGRYDERFTRWGFEDVEMCLRAWLLGYHVAVHPAVTIAHFFREERDNYEVDDVAVTYNFLRMVYLHFSPTRIQKVLHAAAGNPYITPAQELLAESDVFDVRARMLSRRVRDDNWFFQEVNGAIAG